VVDENVAKTSDLLPLDIGLLRSQIFREALDRLTDLRPSWSMPAT
jgi:hypothetical protein